MSKFTELTVEEQQNVNGGGILTALLCYVGFRVADGILESSTGKDIKGWAKEGFDWLKGSLGW